MTLRRILTVMAAVFWLAACTSVPPPIQEMSDARQAIAAALAADARKHSPEKLSEAEQRLRKAEDNLRRRAYAAARREADSAKDFAMQAREEAEASKGLPKRMTEQPLKENE
ncbi:MAG: hypothetical protein AAAFM81_01585 [Pseudomonadota bacterium]